ncbi:helix-turn-helix transcriptional regulator [Paenibacillus lautus]|uniref:helix-turn-helix transcriptional regulator n=1 Tax=Paenibacillus lautus TaxID=1401 RepID=UPI0038508E43
MRKRLRQLRIEKGLSQTYLAKKLGYKTSSGYSNIEYGINRLRFDQALILAGEFGVELSELEEKIFEENLHVKCNKKTA